MNNKQNESGFTLVELMIAMVIGIFLIAGVFGIFSANQRTIRIQTSLSRLQENGRFAIDFLVRDIRMSGYLGCLSFTTLENKLNPHPDYDNLVGVNNHFQLPFLIQGEAAGSRDTGIISGTDSFNLAGDLSKPTATITQQPTLYGDPLKVTPSNLAQNDIVIVMTPDCLSGDLFQLTNVVSGGGVDTLIHNPTSTPAPGNNIQDLEAGLYSAPSAQKHTYEVGSTVVKLNSNTTNYSIRTGESGRPSLFKGANELIEGVEDMQILYGINTDGDVNSSPNYYVDETGVSNWQQVVTVRLSLLVASINDNVTSKPISYYYQGELVTSPDRRLRRVFNTTILLRNHQ